MVAGWIFQIDVPFRLLLIRLLLSLLEIKDDPFLFLDFLFFSSDEKPPSLLQGLGYLAVGRLLGLG